MMADANDANPYCSPLASPVSHVESVDVSVHRATRWRLIPVTLLAAVGAMLLVVGLASIGDGLRVLGIDSILEQRFLDGEDNALATLAVCFGSVITFVSVVSLAAAMRLWKGCWRSGMILAGLVPMLFVVAVGLFVIASLSVTGRS